VKGRVEKKLKREERLLILRKKAIKIQKVRSPTTSEEIKKQQR